MKTAATTAFEEAEPRLLERCGVTVESRYLQLRNPYMRARVLVAGSGPPVLLVHGGGGCAADWAPLMAHLKGFQVFAVDRPGHGLSDPVDYRGSDFRAHAVSFLESVLDRLEIQSAPLVANSMGGLWSFWIALDRPERVTRIVQLGCPALMLDTDAPVVMRLLAVSPLGRIMMSMPPSVDSVRRMYRAFGHGPTLDRIPIELFQLGVGMGRLPGYKTALLSMASRVMTLRGVRSDLRLEEEALRRIAQSTLFIWGDHELAGSPDIARRACAVMPDARLEVLHAGHMTWLAEPVRCGELVTGFLAKALNPV